MIVLAEPDPGDMVQAVKKAIGILPMIDPQAMHNRVCVVFQVICLHEVDNLGSLLEVNVAFFVYVLTFR